MTVGKKVYKWYAARDKREPLFGNCAGARRRPRILALLIPDVNARCSHSSSLFGRNGRVSGERANMLSQPYTLSERPLLSSTTARLRSQRNHFAARWNTRASSFFKAG